MTDGDGCDIDYWEEFGAKRMRKELESKIIIRDNLWKREIWKLIQRAAYREIIKDPKVPKGISREDLEKIIIKMYGGCGKEVYEKLYDGSDWCCVCGLNGYLCDKCKKLEENKK